MKEKKRLLSPLVISVDGPDGAGKSTIVNHICENYPYIRPLAAIELGLMPHTQEERLNWYKYENPIVVAITILASQKKRFSFLDEYVQKLHYKQSNIEQNQPLIVWDRGYTSAKAYSYACLRLNTDLPCDIINQLIGKYFDPVSTIYQVYSIDLYTTIKDSCKYFARATNIIDNHIDLLLIKGQIEYYQKFFRPTNHECNLKLNPFDPLQLNLQKVENFIDQILEKNNSKITQVDKYQQYQPRLYLTSLLNTILTTKRYGNIIIYGQIVACGYSDSIVKVKCEAQDDAQIFALIKNINLVVKKQKLQQNGPHIIITPQCLATQEKL